MRSVQRICQLVTLGAIAASIGTVLAARPSQTAAPVPPQTGIETDEHLYQRVCSTCHPPMGGRRSRNEWTEVINTMIDRGAKVTNEEYDRILNYLVATGGPPGAKTTLDAKVASGPQAGADAKTPQDPLTAAAQEIAGVLRISVGEARRILETGGADLKGPKDRVAVDRAASDRGRTIWARECISCHGTNARGTANAPSLMRSPLLIRNRNGDQLGPFLKTGHPTQTGTPSSGLSDSEVLDLSHFLAQRVRDVLTKGSPLGVINGDPQAGKTFFEGHGGCATCHSVHGNLAGIGSKYDPITLQQRVLFPMSGRGRMANPLKVTVVTPEGETLSGALVEMDDFTITVRESTGLQRTVRRTPPTRIDKSDPFARHIALLDTITDKQLHDVATYLVTFK